MRHQSDQFQGSNGIPYRTSADLELFRQFALGGQLVAGLQRPFNNLSLDLLGNLFVELGLPDRLKFGFYRCYQVRSPRPLVWLSDHWRTDRKSTRLNSS